MTVIPMYSIMPIMSLVMEINGPVAMAGSTFSFSKVDVYKRQADTKPRPKHVHGVQWLL